MAGEVVDVDVLCVLVSDDLHYLPVEIHGYSF
jgi:hypothetical protein